MYLLLKLVTERSFDIVGLIGSPEHSYLFKWMLFDPVYTLLIDIYAEDFPITKFSELL